MLNYNDEKYAGKYVYLPKIGEEATFEIKTLKEVKGDNPKFNFSVKEKIILPDGSVAEKTVDLGYHVEAELKNGKVLSVTNLAAFKSVFKAHNVQDGETIIVRHPDKGKWEVTKK